LAKRIEPFFKEKGYSPDSSTLEKLAPILKERLATLDDAVQLAGFFFEKDVNYQADELIPKGLSKEQTVSILQDSFEIMNHEGPMTKDINESLMRDYVEKSGLSAGQIFGVLRIAVTGQRISPPLFESMEIIGKEIVLARIEKAIGLLK